MRTQNFIYRVLDIMRRDADRDPETYPDALRARKLINEVSLSEIRFIILNISVFSFLACTVKQKSHELFNVYIILACVCKLPDICIVWGHCLLNHITWSVVRWIGSF